jgi:hypothetical protein
VITLSGFYCISVNRGQIQRIWHRFQELDVERKGHLNRKDFCKIPELQTNPIGERIVQSFFTEGQQRRFFPLFLS